jgi:hypothetical protein
MNFKLLERFNALLEKHEFVIWFVIVLLRKLWRKKNMVH